VVSEAEVVHPVVASKVATEASEVDFAEVVEASAVAEVNSHPD
jgi:hypothetical protein